MKIKTIKKEQELEEVRHKYQTMLRNLPHLQQPENPPSDINQMWSSTFEDFFSTDSSSKSKTSSEKGKGLSQNQLCDRFDISSNNVAACAKRAGITSQQWLEQKTGWEFNESNRKYYPPSSN